jgi:hypothetical protein
VQRFSLAILIWIFSAFSPAMASPDVDFPQPGKSYGGKVRGGPGLQYQQVGSLREGDRLRIMTGTGVMMNGFEWFEIRYRNGRSGFQWGGIMCSQKPHPTIYKTCEGLQIRVNRPAANNGLTINGSASVNGTNVVQTDYPGGAFRQSGLRQWQETDARGRVRYNFVENSRDQWSVYLFDASRNVSVQLDLHRKKISVGLANQPRVDFYNITNAVANSNLPSNNHGQGGNPVTIKGHNVGQVQHLGGIYQHVGGSSWQETTLRGQVTHEFLEQGRDEWSVYLYDRSRNIALQLDLHEKKILIGVGHGPKATLHQITSSVAGR